MECRRLRVVSFRGVGFALPICLCLTRTHLISWNLCPNLDFVAGGVAPFGPWAPISAAAVVRPGHGRDTRYHVFHRAGGTIVGALFANAWLAGKLSASELIAINISFGARRRGGGGGGGMGLWAALFLRFSWCDVRARARRTITVQES